MAWLSLTVTVIVAVPLWFGAGVIGHRAVRAAAAEDDVGDRHEGALVVAPVSVRLPAAVSASPTVNANGPTAVPADVV